MKFRSFLTLGLMVALALVTVLSVRTLLADEGSATKVGTVQKAGEKAKVTDAKAAILKAHQQLNQAKAALAKQRKYNCCISPSCDFCALTMAQCPCGPNLRQQKPVCPECFAGWRAGQGESKRIDPQSVQIAPDKMLKKAMEMKRQMLKELKEKTPTTSQAKPKAKHLRQVVLEVEGMTCDACVTNVQTALQQVPGVQSATVSLEEGKAVVALKGKVQPDQLIRAVEEAGYKATSAK